MIDYSGTRTSGPRAPMRPQSWSRRCSAPPPQVRTFFGVKPPLFTDLLQIVKWSPGMSMPAHDDNAFEGVGHRQFSAIVYLNDDYEGGETYFTRLDAAVKP